MLFPREFLDLPEADHRRNHPSYAHHPFSGNHIRFLRREHGLFDVWEDKRMDIRCVALPLVVFLFFFCLHVILWHSHLCPSPLCFTASS